MQGVNSPLDNAPPLGSNFWRFLNNETKLNLTLQHGENSIRLRSLYLVHAGHRQGYDNKLDHMIKVAAEAGFTGIEPMVLEISESALGCGKYWLGDFCDPSS
jgi:hypothetical protein